ncbi:MAG: elongation factor EF-2 [DPANN group archaeon]|nr:elongation factor EF-2 [DPANN group archaeon]
MAENMYDKIKKIVYDQKHIRNLCIAAHIDHGKTTFSDNLLAGAGMISDELAGSMRVTDFDAQEQERGITIFSANVSMVHKGSDGSDYLVNLIDTPGHVDFGGDVTRAMRAVDGSIVLACAVDGVMPQTETVLRQSLKERVKPVLFINKVDRLIKELKFTPEQMQERFVNIITKVNTIIYNVAPEEFKESWQVDVNSGRVGFGSAFKNWAISIPYMKATNMTFKDIIDMTVNGQEKELAKKAPLHKIVLEMAINHLPTPTVAQIYRIPRLWTGEMDSPEGQAMLNCNPDGPLSGVVTNTQIDKHAGLIAAVRLFSGSIKDGDSVHLVNQNKDARVQMVAVYYGPRRHAISPIPCGNIAAVSGISSAMSGETICGVDKIIAPFESIKHVFEPVVTKSIEPKNIKDLPRLITALQQRSKEDQTLVIKISEDTGETLVSGLGELHIEAKIERYLKEKNIDVIISPPIVIYKEGIKKTSTEVEGKSPNKHNKFYMIVEPLTNDIMTAITSGAIRNGKVRKQDQKEVSENLIAVGFEREKSKKVLDVYEGNMLINISRGVQYLDEVMELLKQAFREVCDKGPLADEPVTGLSVLIVDAKLHEDAIHRGPSQVLPAVRSSIKQAMLMSDSSLYEPKQIIRLDVPLNTMGDVMSEVQNRRGQVMDMIEEGDTAVITVKLPVAEMFGFEPSLKSATAGRGFQSLVDIVYEMIPKDVRDQTILQIRKRKGLKEVIPQIIDE